MRIYFLRHADAVPGVDDAVRPLSNLGQRQSQAMAGMLAEADIAFEAAYSSPLTRAQQTAELVLPITNRDRSITLQVTDALLNEAPDFTGWLKSLPEVKHLLLVGHNPSMTEHVCDLLRWKAGASFSMSKGSLVCLKTEDRLSYSLKLLLAPKMLGIK